MSTQTSSIIKNYTGYLNIKEINNLQSNNISGALNSGLQYVSSQNYELEKTFIAFLDDDDWWDAKYLHQCSEMAAKFEWVISGIIRYDKNNPNGIKLPIPSTLTVSQFLIGNPNIQGSNLFVKLKLLQEIGGFDEGLMSTTDRDICIRLLQKSEIRYHFLNYHGVHHWAMDDVVRLSTPGNPLKKKGLQQFYYKYKEMMSEDERSRFLTRSKSLFGIDL